MESTSTYILETPAVLLETQDLLTSIANLTVDEQVDSTDAATGTITYVDRPVTPLTAATQAVEDPGIGQHYSAHGFPEDYLPADLLYYHRVEKSSMQRPRTRSPYSRSPLRSHSPTGTLTASPMARTRSLPTNNAPEALGRLSPSRSPVRPASPLRSSGAARPPRRSFEEVYPNSSMPTFTDIESIAEDSELDLQPRTAGTPDRELQPSPILAPPARTSFSFSRSNSGRRRPGSPLHQLSLVPPPSSWTPSGSFATSTASSSESVDSTAKFNEVYPSHSYSVSATSSMPSTPTSLRSRSPSISSLETIPDSPDAEEQATEAYNVARLKAAADAEYEGKVRGGGSGGGGGSLDVPRVVGFLKDSKRKRWSVCGAERRGDFEMETIWED